MMKSRDDKPDKRTAILKAALMLIAENGFHGAPTSKIAGKAGVGVGSIYRYFKDKENLIHELFRYVEEESSREILIDHDPHAPIRQQYLRLCFNFFHYLIEHPVIFAFMEQYFNSPFGISRKREILATDNKNAPSAKRHPVHNLLEAAKKQQVIKNLPFPVLGALTFGPLLFLVRDICAGLFRLDADMVRKTVEACWDAVKR